MAITSFFSALRSELAHVVWPKRSTTIKSAIFVIVIALLVAYYLGAWDALFSYLLKLVIS